MVSPERVVLVVPPVVVIDLSFVTLECILKIIMYQY